MLGREHELESPPVTFVETRPTAIRPVIMRVQIVPHDVDRPSGVAVGQRVHELDCGLGGASWDHPAEDTARLHVEGREQHLGTVALVLVLAAHRPITPIDPVGRAPLQDLHGLLVYAEHHSVVRWVQVQVANPLSLRRELRVAAFEPLADAMGAQGFEAQDAPHLTHAESMARTGIERVC